MACFTFESRYVEKEDMSPEKIQETLFAINTAKKLVNYYQYFAISTYFNQTVMPRPPLTTKEKALVNDFEKAVNSFKLPKTYMGLVALKIMYGAQMDFYQNNPHLMSVFGQNGNMFVMTMPLFVSYKGKTCKAVDKYFEQTVHDMVKFAESGFTKPIKTNYSKRIL